MRLLFLLLLLLPSGCSTVAQQLDPTVFYKRDAQICIAGQCSEGTAVLPPSSSYTLDFKFKGAGDLFTFTTCHRDMSQEQVGMKAHVFYSPIPGMEDGAGCDIEVGAYEKAKGRHSWALIDLEDPQTTLPATLKCNGVITESHGVSICQSRMGLLESVSFPDEVRLASPRAGCSIPVTKDSLTFTFVLSKGECVYAFMETAAPNRMHRFTTIGYESILIRDQ